MKFSILLVLLTIGTTFAGTHVNISFSQQQHSKNSDNLAESRNGQLQLKPSDSLEQFQTSSNYRGDQNDRLARIQVDDKKANNDNYKNQNVAVDSKMNREPAPEYQTRSERVHNSGRSGHFNHQPSQDQRRGFYNSRNGDQQQYDQFRKMNAQDKQNMEFERYIQNYHSGPTVETVYESAKPENQHASATSSIDEGPQRVVAINQRMSRLQKFERQVALPSKADNLQPATDDNTQPQAVVKNQPVQVSEKAASTAPLSSSSSSSSSSVPSVSSTDGNNFKVSLNQRPASVGNDGINFDLSTSYNKPNYNDPTFKYSNDNSDSHFHNQFPPSVDESQGGYGDYFQPSYGNNDDHYYGNFYDRQNVGGGYLPPEHMNQRPLVTKTIQIAQPAIKAKKYEVRHPAIQKEFYDIEERVLIKPAGTVVVELERPVAKILKGETTLPLGHPHPAVAGAYMNNGNTQSFSNIIYSSAGGSNQANNQYSPSSHSTKNSPEHASTIASSVTNTPTFDQSAKEVVVESNLNKPYNGDNHFVAAATADEPKSQNREIVVLTDGHGNQRQLSPDQFTYSRDETDKPAPRPVYSHRNPFTYNDKSRNGHVNIAPQQRTVQYLESNNNNNGHVAPQQRSGFQDSNKNNGQTNIAPQRSGFHSNLSNRDGLNFDAEYINSAANLKQDSKPARLQEASSRMTNEQQQPIIKHEHKIVLSPSQHNIYLTGQHEVPQAKFVAEAAHVREIKPYLQNHRGPVIVYASSKQTPDLGYVQRSEYQPQARVSSQVVHYREPARVSQAKSTNKRVEYSAPYAQMRYHPDDEPQAHYTQHQRDFSNYDRNDRRQSEKLILEDKPKTEMMLTKKSEDNTRSMMEKQAPQAHIEIEIPHTHSSQDANKAIVVSSTIRPMMMNDGEDQMHNSKLEISVTSNGEPMQQQQKPLKNQDTKDNYEKDKKEEQQEHNLQYNDNDSDTENLSNLKTKPDCDQPAAANYESHQDRSNYGQQKFMRIVEVPNASATTASDGKTAGEPAAVTNIQPNNVDVNARSTIGHHHIDTPGSRVIAATPAPKESAPSESLNKRRIVVNHPFQTVREVVEHEPYTNYHEVQVNEPASPAVYHSANYFQPNGELRQLEHGHFYYQR